MNITGNEPAMPIFSEHGYPSVIKAVTDENRAQCFGLTIRQHFAGLAMQAFASNPELIKMVNQNVKPEDQAAFLAQASFEQADAMIAESNKPQSK